MNKTVLIIGNGISRISYDKEIRAFAGETGGCNDIYKEYGEILSIISGHEQSMREAIKYREEKGFDYKILKGLVWSGKVGELEYTCNPKYRQNTGAALIAEGLTLGCDVVLCGFDFGGRDCFDIGHDTLDLSVWVKAMRLIISDFGESRISFIGHNHLPFLLSDNPDTFYSDLYLKGKPHIDDERYQNIHNMKNKEESKFNGKFRDSILKNIGKKEIGIKSTGIIMHPGESRKVDSMIAFKFVRYYPDDFEVYSV